MSNVVKAQFGAGNQQQAASSNRSCVMENKRRGFVASYRSTGDASWAEDVYLLASWQRMLWLAQSSRQRVEFNGQLWDLERGQLVLVPERFGRKLKDRQGRPMPRMAVRRMLDWFEQQGMITRAGTDKGTVITLVNYDAYQSLISLVRADQPSDQPTDQPSDHRKASADAGLSGIADRPTDHQSDQASVPEEQPCKEQQEDLRAKDLTSGTADAVPNLPTEPETIPVEAAIHARQGKRLLWGTAEDLQLAQQMAAGVQAMQGEHYRAPNWAAWANEIRLMRERDRREPRHIAALFAFANQDGFWQANILSPDALRRQWGKLAAARNSLRASRRQPLSNLAAAQAAAQALKASGKVTYDDDTPL